MRRFRYEYGASPGHLVAGAAAVGVGAWAIVRVFGLVGPPEDLIRWFLGSILLHDLVAVPLYSAVGVIALTVIVRRHPTPVRLAVLNHLRVPGLLSALAFLVWYPLILSRAPEAFARATGSSTDVYLGRWLLLTAALFAISAIMLLVRLPRLRAQS